VNGSIISRLNRRIAGQYIADVEDEEVTAVVE